MQKLLIWHFPRANKFPRPFDKMALPRRALIAVTSAVASLHEGHPTGVFIEEALHPFNIFIGNGFEVDIVSEKGTYGLDWLSQQPDFYPPEDRAQFEDLSGDFRRKLDAGLTPEQVDASKVKSLS